MKRWKTISHKFVEYIPSELTDGAVYVSIQYATVVHRCCCGCGNKVVTPLSPADWQLSYDGESISLEPSIGNWSFPCKSHYWITKDRVIWARRWSQEDIDMRRYEDIEAKRRHFDGLENSGADDKRKHAKERKPGKRSQKPRKS